MKHCMKYCLLSLVMIATYASNAQLKTYSFEQVDSLQKNEKKNLIVFIHADWCNYCQLMKNTTFKDTNLIQEINSNFWFLSLNAEEKLDIKFHNSTFKFKPTGANTGINELAEQLALFNGEISYPTLCIINTDYEIIFQYNQFLSANDLLTILGKIVPKRNSN